MDCGRLLHPGALVRNRVSCGVSWSMYFHEADGCPVYRSPVRGKRHMALFKFYCDESYDSPNQKRRPGDPPYQARSHVAAGLFGSEPVWSKVERQWSRRNELEGVARFHAAHLNAGTWEFDGWTKPRRIDYSKGLLKVIKRQGDRLHGVSIGLFADDYRRIISLDGQVKLGPPHLLCFKTLIAQIASMMDQADYPLDDKVAVIIDRGPYETECVELFYKLKDYRQFRYRHRLATCTPGAAEEFIGLQVADYLAYETFRLIDARRKDSTAAFRKPLKAIFGVNGLMGLALGEEIFESIKAAVDAAFPCEPNSFFLIPPQLTQADSDRLPRI